MYNGLNILQSCDFGKISCETYIDKICTEHEKSWMKTFEITDDRPTPLPTSDNFIKRLLSAVGDPDVKVQAALAKKMGFGFRQGIGELIYAMVTCRPDIAFAVVKLAQSSACPSEIHYHAVRHCLKYLRKTKADGIHFWRTHPREDL